MMSGVMLSLAGLCSGCFPNNRINFSYSREEPRATYVNEQISPYLWERNPACSQDNSSYPYNSQNNPTFNDGGYSERQAWRDNARTSPLIFENSRQVERHIRDETRGANFNNPVDRNHAEIRANQIREEAWRNQTRGWNQELDRRGAVRKRN